MADNVEITCIKATNRVDPHERIHTVGGINDSGTSWSLTLNEAIAGIEAGKWKFYTYDNGQLAWVTIATHNDRKYLKTEADEVHPNNLLALPECP